jgi:hypothetical protein
MKRLLRSPKILYTILMTVAACLVGIVRLIWWEYYISLRGPLGFFALPALCPFSVIAVTAVFGLFLLSLISIHRTRSAIPILVLIIGVFLAFQLPLSSRPPTPEEEFFLAQRSDFETVVQLARQAKLEQALPNCPAGYHAPLEYQFVSSAACMFVNTYDDSGLTVVFRPFESYHPIVYVDKPTKFPCNEQDAFIEKQIDDHWYVCQVDWP